MKELSSGDAARNDFLGGSTRRTGDALNAAPVSRRGHFVYAILDILQGYIRFLKPGKPLNEASSLALSVAKTVSHSFLRCKAFELLSIISLTNAIVEDDVSEALRADEWPKAKSKQTRQWRGVRSRVMKMDMKMGDFVEATGRPLEAVQVNHDISADMQDTSSSNVHYCPPHRLLKTEITALTRISASSKKLASVLSELEKSLRCPITPSDTDLGQLVPCTHVLSRSAWLNLRQEATDLGQVYYPLCRRRVEYFGSVFPAGVRELIEELRNESSKLLQSTNFGLREGRSVAEALDTRSVTTENTTRQSPVSFTDPPTERFQQNVTFRLHSSTVGPKNGSYQATAISTACSRIALIGKNEFHVYEPPRVENVCWGHWDGRFRSHAQSSSAPEWHGINADTLTQYYKAVMNDDVLIIASAGLWLDLRNASTGQRLSTYRQAARCRCLGLSSDGKVLAIGLDTGELNIRWAALNFNSSIVVNLLPVAGSFSVKCIAFSPNSELIAACTADNAVRWFQLGSEGDSPKVIDGIKLTFPPRDEIPGIGDIAL